MPRPELRELGVRDWVDAMAKADGLTTRLSTPGQHAQLVATRLGSRSSLLDLVSGPLRPALSIFRLTPTAASRNAVKNAPADEVERVVVIDDRPFATFARLRHLAADGSDSSVRATLDELCRVRLARRGLLLHCVDCGRASFLSIDDIGQRYDCPRCGAGNDLTQPRWHQPMGEPQWYYDLHSSFRELLSTGGDVPILAGASLRRSSPRYSDCAEIEFLDGGKRVAEIDLIAHVNDEVIVAEAKTSTGLGSSANKRKDSARKLARVASLLRADVVLLATTEELPWSSTTIADVRAAVTAAFRSLPTPEVRTSVGL